MPIPFEPGAIRALARLMTETGLTEIELEEDDRRIRLVRGGGQPALQHVAAFAPAVAEPSAPAALAAAPAAVHPGAVLSPMVGVVYFTPEPGAPPFVTVGAKVETGQTLLLIEAMKTFNPIVAPRGGTVTQILLESGASVESGDALVVIE